MDGKNIEIHETAFVTSAFRAFDENLSQDPYSKLWVNSKTRKWIEEYLDQVSSEETYTHCLRNRYFLDTIREFADNGEIEFLINFGSGFSMYPFLLDENLINIEIDKPEIVDYKKAKLDRWQRHNKLPNRTIYFIGVNFSQDYWDDLLAKINSIKSNKPCFVLIEGVLFFLNKQETDKLFNFFGLIQNKGDYVGSASFQDSIKDTLAFRNLISFFNQTVSKTTVDDYQTIPDSYYTSLKNYSLIDHQDYFSLSKKYENKVKLDKALILNENFYLLRKSE